MQKTIRMQVDFRKMLSIGLMWLLSFILLMWVFGLSSCSDAKLAQKHYKKAVKHGYRCDTETDTIEIEKVDSFPIIQNDTIVWKYYITKRDTIVKYKTSYIPKTRYELRYDLRRERSVLRNQRKVNNTLIRNKQRSFVKSARNQSRQNPIHQLKGLIIWGVVLLICFIALNFIKKIY